MTPVPADILWIVTTQWRAQAGGWAGDPNARTPHLDALARSGWNFTQTVTPHPFGPFARAALLTGVLCPDNGVRDYYDPLPCGTRTIAHRMRSLGYATAWFGKWHLARRDPGAPLVGEEHARMIVPEEARGGFDFWEGFESGFQLNDPWLHGTRLPEPERFHGYQSEILLRRAADWLSQEASGGHGVPEVRRRQRRPRFVVVSLEAPHPPYAAPANGFHFLDTHALALPANVPLGGDVERQARRELSGYYAHLEATDRAIGRFLETPEARRSWIVFTSVHGDMHGAHGLFRKGWPHEESVRVPLFLRAPIEPLGSVRPRSDTDASAVGGEYATGVSPRARVSSPPGGFRENDCISLLDLGWLTLSLATQTAESRPALSMGMPSSTAAPGKTVTAVQTGHEAQPLRPSDTEPRSFSSISMPSVVRLPHQCDRVWRGVRTPGHKLVLNEDGSPWLCFDLREDPFELHNLALDDTRRNLLQELIERHAAALMSDTVGR